MDSKIQNNDNEIQLIEEPVYLTAGSIQLVYYYPDVRVGQAENALEIFRHRCAQLSQLPPSIAESRASDGHKFLSNSCAHLFRVISPEGDNTTYNELHADTIVADALRNDVRDSDHDVLEAAFQDFFTRRKFGSLALQVLRGERKTDMMTRFLQLTAMNRSSMPSSGD